MTSTKIDYQKRKNKELFRQFETNAYIALSEAQNYIPVYKNYFELNETNYNNINLNHEWHLTKIQSSVNTTNCFKCVLSNDETTKTKNVFFKMAPLLDPYKYMSGKYNIRDSTLLSVPTFTSNTNIHPKIMDSNNSSYVDGFFSFLSNRLLEQGFVNGVEYYGSCLGIKNNFTCNIIDDIEYLATSEFFNANKGTLFDTQDYSHLLEFNVEDESVKKRQQPIMISDDLCLLDIEDLNKDLTTLDTFVPLDNNCLEEVEITIDTNVNATTIKSSSSCSSRTSHTNSDDSFVMSDDSDNEENKEGEEGVKETCTSDNSDNSDNDSANFEDVSSNSNYSEDEVLNATIPKFPVQMIAMEYCENTLDKLIYTNKLTNEEWFAILMQVVMTLIAYQQVYSMTHNDLHTNNVMFVPTDKKYLYYCYKDVHYKVPTFGRIFKLIDFGRAIYKFEDVLFCSDSFQAGGDASTQYNTEPFLCGKKARLDPNYSFDLCRLACSIFDYVISDMSEIKDLAMKEAFVRVIVEWCIDDNGINVLYKNNGAERYPEFKLYKMIARHVHKHTPQAQLERKEFSRFAVQKQDVKRGEPVMNIDLLC